MAGARTARRLIALVDVNGQRAGVAVEVLEGDVARVARATAPGGGPGRGAAEGFDARAVLGGHHGDVLDEDVGDDVGGAGVLA